MLPTRAASDKKRFVASLVTLQFLLALTLGFVLTSFAPAYAAGGLTGNLSGTVQTSTGMPVSGAVVDLVSPSGSYKQTTDAKGSFLFLNINVDTYVISVQAIGYEPFGREGVTVTGDSSGTIGTIQLGKLNVPKQIAIVRSRSQSSAFQPTATVPSFTIGGTVLEAAQGKTSNASETSVLLASPGFQVDKAGNLVLDGSTTDEVHFFFDGVDFTDPGFNRNGNNYFFNGIASTQIVPGAGDPSQGDAGAGAVNLVVRRGTYPAAGQVDAELLSRPFDHQFNLEYGAATKNNSVSEFFSYFKDDFNNQYGAFGSSSFDNSIFYNQTAYTAENDFVNNLVFHFGKDNSQSFQFLYYTNSTEEDSNYGNAPLQYDNVSPTEIGFTAALTGLTNPEAQSLIAHEPGQYPGGTPTQPDMVSSTTLMKFEYNNQLNATTALDLRYFNANYLQASPTVSEEGAFPEDPYFGAQTAGGSRTGLLLNVTKQAGSNNLLTFSGNVEDARPNFGDTFQPQGIYSLGANAALFLRPTNPNLPVSASNPCPMDSTANPEACFLQQYYYQKGGTPLPPAVDLQSTNLQHFYGTGIRDQLQVGSKLKLDLGLRYDLIDEGYGGDLAYEDEADQAVPGSPSTFYPHNYEGVEHPHFIEPRLGASFRIDQTDSVAFTYGKSINETGSGEQASPENFSAFQQFANIPITPALANVFQQGTTFGNPAPAVINAGTPNANILCNTAVPYPIGATANSSDSYKGSIGTTLQFGKPCGNLGQLLYSQDDVYYPEIVAVTPAIFENYDFNYSHQFRDGSAIRVAPFFRQGTNIQIETTPLVFNPATGQYTTGSIVGEPDGKQTTTGIDLSYTLPERKYGINGFLNATYVNEFTNTPAAGDNFEGQDFEPVVLPASYATGDMYRAGFVSPLTANLGLSYTTKSGFRINPVLHFNNGFPYNAGSLTPYLSPVYGAFNVPNTNLTDQFGAAGAPSYVDPANPGSVKSPIVSATRGEKETPTGGGLLSRPQVTSDLTLEYSPPGSRTTFGIVGQDLFNNEIYAAPAINGNYYPVSTGVAGPLTGQGVTGAVFPTLANVVAKNTYPYGQYNVPYSLNGLPFTLRLYVQYKL